MHRAIKRIPNSLKIDPEHWQELVEQAKLSVAEEGALIRLWIAAWGAIECALTLPEMRQASRLTVPEWDASHLYVNIGLWFKLLPDGRFQVRDLMSQREQRKRRSEQNRANAMKRWAGVRPPCPSPSPHVDAVASPPDATASTVEHAIAPAEDAVASTINGAGGRTAHNVNAQTCLRLETGTEGGPSLSASTSPPRSTVQEATQPIKVDPSRFYAAASPAPATSTENRGGVCGSSSLLNKETHKEGGGGGTAPMPRQAAQEAARRILDAYEHQVCSAYPPTPQAYKEAAYWLNHGHDEAELMECLANYGAEMDALGKASRYRRSPINFFGRKECFFLSYKKRRGPKTGMPAKPRPEALPRPMERPATATEMRSFLDRARARLAATFS